MHRKWDSCLLFVTLAISPIASAQSINFVVNHTSGSGGVQPSVAQQGAAGQGGFWSRSIGIVNAGTPIAIRNLAGATTPITLTLNAATSTINSTTNGNLATAPADYQALLCGVWAIGGGGSSRTMTLNNLWSGTYDVYVYAMAPDSGTFITNVTINGQTQGVGGTYNWPTAFALNQTHSLHRNISVTNGTIVITAQTSSGQGSVAGIQLVLTSPPTGACCLLHKCVVARQSDCVAAGGTYAGDFVACSTAVCAACAGDIDPPGGDNKVDVNDLLKVINTWGVCP